MRKIVLYIVLALTSVFAYENSDEFINEINSKQNLWKAGRNFPKDTPVSELRGLLGAKPLPQHILESLPLMEYDIDESEEIPEYFDAREKWPQCKLMKQIRDQSACGSCWAVSVTSSISDRICIHSNGNLQPDISARNLLSCSKYLSQGCHGGYPYYAFQYWVTDGLVTGGPYESNIGCQPYPFPPCDVSDEILEGKQKCTTDYPTPECVKECSNSTIDFKKDLYYGKMAYRVSGLENHIQMEIMKNGPVVAAFLIYSDFYHYKSGVYVHTTGYSQGRHAVRLIGWGVESGTKYWLAVNSFNEDWGDKGYFKIRRGVNEAAFETDVTAGLPLLN